ncbi:hypothetical protein LUX29_21540 [Aureimonas altamirensis]|uniref:hypothetical protein n=1 Tax=Aureimonas altamirensis TaxID=370622 RepID=UPI001E36CE1D|nr:hypothetical protein [Aureimonas altamirensis]UHD45539.1 hypothetical protein LUX29_21540 [Aureimonas altamirensis]
MTQEQTLMSEYEVGARRIAEAIIAKAVAPGASDDDRTNAETATIILGNAEKRAGLVDRSTYEAIIIEIKEFHEQCEAQIMDMTRHGASAEEIQEAVHQSVAQSEALELQMKAMIDREATNAWQEAFDHLARMIDASEPGLAN